VDDPSFDPARCPICERENACGMAAGAATCWCFSVEMPREVIDRVPAGARGVACVCRACAARGEG
jgi:hypothetical protein